MAINITKERILKKISLAIKDRTEKPFPKVDENAQVFNFPKEELAVVFANEFTRLNGNFSYCEDELEMIGQIRSLAETKGWKNLHCWHPVLQEMFKTVDFRNAKMGKILDKADAGITFCEAIIARTGSILLSSAMPSGRTLSVFPEVHICIAFTDQILPDLKDGIALMKEKYGDKLPSFFTFASGPSRTADIEKTLVLGAHGPKEVYLFLIEK